jgi:hypothetical protein
MLTKFFFDLNHLRKRRRRSGNTTGLMANAFL